MNTRKISFEELDQAVKASYKLGVLAGQDDIRNQLQDMRQQLQNMLKTNKELFRDAMAEHKQHHYITISPIFAKGLLIILKKVQERGSYKQLKYKYENATGEKVKIRKGKVCYERRKEKPGQ